MIKKEPIAEALHDGDYVKVSNIELSWITSSDPGPADLFEFKINISHRIRGEFNECVIKYFLTDEPTAYKCWRNFLALIMSSSSIEVLSCFDCLKEVELLYEVYDDKLHIVSNHIDNMIPFILNIDETMLLNPEYHLQK